MAIKIDKYREIEKKFFNQIKKLFGNKLLLYCVTGGLGRGEINPGWSDIDVLLVFDTEYDNLFWQKMRRVFSKKYSIKIGCTFYSLKEFNSKLYKDSKTLQSILSIRDGFYKPRILNPKVKLNKINYSMVKMYDLASFAGALHSLKRELLIYPNFDEKKILKIIYKMMKIILQLKRYKTYGYKDTADVFYKLFPGLGYILTPHDIVANKVFFNKRYEFYLNFLKYVKRIEYAKI